jgi:nitrate reductase assembly molybdenum cofactor insertion protein NarJ
MEVKKKLVEQYKDSGVSTQHKENVEYASTFLNILNGTYKEEKPQRSESSEVVSKLKKYAKGLSKVNEGLSEKENQALVEEAIKLLNQVK